MAQQGLQIRDEQGRITLDVSDRVCKIIGRVDVTWPRGSVGLPSLQGNQVFMLFNPVFKNEISLLMYDRPRFVVSGHVISWSYSETNPDYIISGSLIYGLY